ncbi:MAG: hypothetical protein M1834_006252 [Cirrosporium novae-zelandiae]|nr:MAG: hypothetical protein M1834_006252 [Cirrosporium novae-zelandiae]
MNWQYGYDSLRRTLEDLKSRILRRGIHTDYVWKPSDGIKFSVSTSTLRPPRRRDVPANYTWIYGNAIKFSSAPSVAYPATPSRRLDESESSNAPLKTAHVPQCEEKTSHSFFGPLINFRPSSSLHFFSSATSVSDVEIDTTLEQKEEVNIEPVLDIAARWSEQPQGELSYRLSASVQKEVLDALKRKAEIPYWKSSFYESPKGDKVDIRYCTSKETSEKVAQLFLGKKVIGFDIEWIPNSRLCDGVRKNVSLIQFASEERVALFHIARYGKSNSDNDLVAPTLKKIMESPDVTKVGVAIKADCTRLKRFLSVDSKGLLELSHLYRLVKYSGGNEKLINKRLVSLATQVKEYLYLPLYKGEEVRGGDWTQFLNREQTTYAASDPYACLHLYDTLEARRKALIPCPPHPAPAECNLPIKLANGNVSSSADDSDDSDDSDEAEETEEEEIKDKPSQAPRSTRSKISDKRGPEVLMAETWVEQWLSVLPPSRERKTSVPSLRAYALWHEQGLEPCKAAELLRDPPLQATTVATYILRAIIQEKLPYDDQRTKDLFMSLPESGKWRYKSIQQKVDRAFPEDIKD